MAKKAKDIRTTGYNPAVDELNIDKEKFSVHNLIDYDRKYLDDMHKNPEAKKWLAQFTDEYYNGRFDRVNTHGKKSILANRKELLNEYARIKKNPEEYKKFQQELFEENQKKVGGYPLFRERAYARFCQLLKTQDPVELKKFNKYVQGNYTLPIKKQHWRDPDESITPKKYRVSDPITFLRDRIVRERGNFVVKMKKDYMGRDFDRTKLVNTDTAKGDEESVINDFIDLKVMERPDLAEGLSKGNDEIDEYIELYNHFKDRGRFDLFIEEMFYDNLNDFISVEKDKVFSQKIKAFVEEVYERRKAKKVTKVMYFWNLCIANFAMVTHLHNNKRDLGKIGSLDKIFNKFVFKYKKEDKNMVLDIPREFVNE